MQHHPAAGSHGISPATQAMLEEMRRKMLFRRDRDVGEGTSSAQQQSHAEALRAALFEGRAVTVQRLEQPQVPSPAVADAESDPHRLFQMLRRKKRNVAHGNNGGALSGIGISGTGCSAGGGASSGSTGSSPMKATAPKTQPPTSLSRSQGGSASYQLDGSGGSAGDGALSGPQPPTAGASLDSSAHWWSPPSGEREHPSARETIHHQRHASSARPAAAKRPGSSLRDRSDVHSATSASTHDGRPVTRQKHPKMALDLFPSSSPQKAGGAGGGGHSAPPDRFPPKPVTRRYSAGIGGRATRADRNSPPQHQPDDAPSARVDFNCLFFNSDDDLDAHEEFPPAARAQVDIPLIETDWFTSDTFELLPTTDGVEQLRDEELDPADESPRYAESLYGMLVAQKRPRRSSAAL